MENPPEIQPVSALVNSIKTPCFIVVIPSDEPSGIRFEKSIVQNLKPTTKIVKEFPKEGEVGIINNFLFVMYGFEQAVECLFCLTISGVNRISKEFQEMANSSGANINAGVASLNQSLCDLTSNITIKYGENFYRFIEENNVFICYSKNSNFPLLIRPENTINSQEITEYNCRRCGGMVNIDHVWWRTRGYLCSFRSLDSPQNFDYLCSYCICFNCTKCGKSVVRSEHQGIVEKDCLKTTKLPTKTYFMCPDCFREITPWNKVMKRVKFDLLLRPFL